MILTIQNIDPKWQNKDVQQLFTAYGSVQSAEVAIDVFTEQSRGFAQVDMPDEEEAGKAITALNNAVVGGRQLQVNETVTRPKQTGSYKVGNGVTSGYKFRK
jgi:RNA recognition motif-containing protein